MSDAILHPQSQDPVQRIEQRLAPLRRALLDHKLYAKLGSLEACRIFTEQHCFAVWDFMSLLKTLQNRITCTRAPWAPRPNGEAIRMINEIVIVEESDERPDGRSYTSHYQLYLESMREIGADTGRIEELVGNIASGMSWREALHQAQLHDSARRFVTRTLELCETGETWEIAADFVFGREALIPDMFRQILTQLAKERNLPIETFSYYLERHIEVDEEQHGPASRRLLRSLCQKNPSRWAAVEKIAHQALEQRIELWDGVLAQVSLAGAATG